MKKKWQDVQKFGGTDNLGKTSLNASEHELSSIEVQSKKKLEDDRGEGNAAIIRRFTFYMNPETFRNVPPTKQQLFNSHIKGIEVMLWRDGMRIMTEIEPRITIDKKTYTIFVGARPAKGHILKEIPQTLRQIAHA